MATQGIVLYVLCLRKSLPKGISPDKEHLGGAIVHCREPALQPSFCNSKGHCGAKSDAIGLFRIGNRRSTSREQSGQAFGHQDAFPVQTSGVFF